MLAVLWSFTANLLLNLLSAHYLYFFISKQACFQGAKSQQICDLDENLSEITDQIVTKL